MRRFPVTIGEYDILSRVPDPPPRTHRRERGRVAIVEPARPGYAASSGSGGYIAGGASDGAPTDSADCVDCG